MAVLKGMCHSFLPILRNAGAEAQGRERTRIRNGARAPEKVTSDSSSVGHVLLRCQGCVSRLCKQYQGLLPRFYHPGHISIELPDGRLFNAKSQKTD